MALGLGYGLPFAVKRPVQGFAEDVTLATNNALADAAQREVAGNCLTARAMQIMQDVQTQPSLLIVPQLYKAGVLYDQLPTTRTNFIPNNSMAGATGSVLPTTWSSGSIPAGITVSYSASGTAVAADGTSVNYIDVTVSGTAGASGFLNIRPNPSPSTIAAFVGQSWNTSVYLQLISGSVASISPTWQLQELNSSQVFLQGSNITGLGSLVVGGQFDRYNVSRVLTDSATAFVTCRWGHSFVSGTTYSYTIRIASPQLERLGVATPMIATSTGAVTRLNESTNVVGLPPEFTVSRNTTATRVNSSGLIESVASGVPRIDWLGQSCPALLVEASGQNLALRSEAFNVSGTWALVSSGTGSLPVVSANAVISPDGSQTADTVVFDRGAGNTTNDRSFLEQSITIPTTGTYIFSVYAKASASGDVGKQIFIRLGGAGALTAITLTANWTRYSRVETSLASGSQVVQIGNRGTFTADNSVGVDLWGAQLETGSVATTYIPTTTGTGSRAAETISASGALVSGLIGQTEGTVYVEYNNQTLGVEGYAIRLVAASFDNSVHIRRSTANLVTLELRSAGSSVFSQTLAATGFVKAAIAYKSGDIAAFVNGTQAGSTSTSAFTFGASFTSVNLGTFGTAAFLNDRIRAAALYTTRLTNDQLAELTRL